MRWKFNRNNDFQIAEYNNLSHYFSTVITFRFTTVAFFIAAVALMLRINNPTIYHYILLFLISVGIWLVELRNRAIFYNLIERGWEIEKKWADHEKGILPFFTHMTPWDAAKKYPKIPEESRRFDKTRILWFTRFSARCISHTMGLDIIYLSVIGYSLWLLFSKLDLPSKGGVMISSQALVTLIVFLSGIYLIRTGTVKKRVRWAKCVLIIGMSLSFLALVAMTLLVFF